MGEISWIKACWWRRLGGIALSGLLVLCLPEVPSWGETVVAEREKLLVGVSLRNLRGTEAEVGTLDIYQQNDTFLIPLQEFAKIADVQISKALIDPRNIQVTTPLGTVEFLASDLQEIQGSTYITSNLLEQKLAILLQFNPKQFTLVVNLPWQSGTPLSSAPRQLPKPDIRPPGNSLSNIYLSTGYYNQQDGSSNLFTSSRVGGRLLGGSWQVNLDNTSALNPSKTPFQPRFQQYFYLNRFGPVRYLLGRQQLSLHPLLGGQDFTGAQIAYTNKPNLFADQVIHAGTVLLPRQSIAMQTFRGTAAAASYVQLRVEGTAVAEQQVGLDGRYEFLDIPLPYGQSSQIQLVIFDRNNLRVPKEVRTLRLSASNLLLPQGAMTQLAGAGVSGNLLQNGFVNPSTSGFNGSPVGFYQWRQGISDDLTTEITLQKIPQHYQAAAGAIWRFSRDWLMSLGLATNFKNHYAYGFDLEYQRNPWRILLNSQLIPQQFFYNTNSTRIGNPHNHSLDLSYQVNSKLNLGVIARNYSDGIKTSEYILPSIAWQPMQGAFLFARPDIFGTYNISLNYIANSKTQLAFYSYAGISTLDFTYRLTQQNQVNFGTNFDNQIDPRYYLIFTRNSLNSNQLGFNVGLSLRQGQPGVIVGAQMELIPGLLAQAQYQSQLRFDSTDGGNNATLFIGLTTDLSIQRGRIRPTRTASLLGSNRGGISGRLRIEGGTDLPRYSLEGALVSVRAANRSSQAIDRTRFLNRQADQATVYTDAHGNYTINNLQPGIYTVRLIPEGLPVELVPTQTTVVVEVTGGTLTPYDFIMRPQFGVAGRVSNARSQPLSGVLVEVLTMTDEKVKSGVTDQFGLYRIDGLSPGRYTIRIAPASLPSNTVMPQRSVEITNDFLFQQNLQVAP